MGCVAHEGGPIQLPFCMEPLTAQCGNRTSSTWQIILAGDGRVRDGFADGDGTAKARQLAGPYFFTRSLLLAAAQRTALYV